MDKLTHYQNLVIQLLENHEKMARPDHDDYEPHTIFDKEKNRYMLFHVGWSGRKRIHIPTLYVHVKNGKIWIEEDWTEDGIATELLHANVPKSDIVLAFHHPKKRPYTEFAVA